MNIQILYFSGAGATKYIAEQMAENLGKSVCIRLCPVEQAQDVDLRWCDALIVGTPVYHAAPARLVMEYVEAILPLPRPKPVFIYNTRGLYSCNTNRILAKNLAEKNLRTVLDRAYRGPASDGSLIAPFIGRFFHFQPNLREKIVRDCHCLLQLLRQGGGRSYIPRFHLSSILNAPNKLAGQLITFRLHLHKERCVCCGKCVEQCPHRALEKDAAGYPVFLRRRCKNCYRCIHHCPKMAWSLSKRRAPKKVLGFLGTKSANPPSS